MMSPITVEGSGPLAGARVLEFAGSGPAPYGAMLLGDLGADVVRIDRPGSGPGDPENILNRGKRSIAIDLARPEARTVVRGLIESAEVLIEPFRPGVMERRGLSPEVCLGWNPSLVYARMTGWGQSGPASSTAGHDLDFIAVTGLLHAVGDEGGPPQIPLNVAGDFGGGGAFLVIGVLAGVLQARATGLGTVVDAAMVDGAASLLAGLHTMVNGGRWTDRRGTNLLDGGAPFYSVYRCADDRYLAVAAIESRFYREFVRIAGVDADPGLQHDRASWPQLRVRIADAVHTRTLEDWMTRFADTDACVAPVESLLSADANGHVHARGSILREAAGIQPGVAPRLSGHDAQVPPIGTSPRVGQHTHEILEGLGMDASELLGSGVVEAAVSDAERAVRQ